jgi:anhydro-N-acetylmuramic acid kinase
MSGTSLDGVDAVLVDFSAVKPQVLATHYISFDESLKRDLLALHTPQNNELHRAQIVGNQLARLYAQCVLELRVKHDCQVRAIGCHGQTIRHCPEYGYSLQIGNAALLAELTNLTVINDFRSRDIAAGGQGAPLVPAFHDQILRHLDIHRVIVNIGGISNLTNLSPELPTTGFDCGTGNMLMDAWCQQHCNQPYDQNGAWAAQGDILPVLLQKLLEEPFFALSPPKSSGRDLFNMSWLTKKLQGCERAVDVQATLLELTCQTIVNSISQHCEGATEIYLCGGGTHNQTLRNRLKVLLPPTCVLESTDALGVNSDYLEAIAFAWLAHKNQQGIAANLPDVTGARRACVLGVVHHAGTV